MTPRELAERHIARFASAQPRETPEQGTIIGRKKRPDKGELRLSKHEYNGRPYYRLAVWDGDWPEKGKQVAVRESELGDLLLWLCDAVEAVK
jgi:hypothetical protein